MLQENFPRCLQAGDGVVMGGITFPFRLLADAILTMDDRILFGYQKELDPEILISCFEKVISQTQASSSTSQSSFQIRKVFSLAA